MSDNSWSVFPNGTSFEIWTSRNCDRCANNYDRNPPKGPTSFFCGIEEAINVASILDGRIEESSREEIGRRLKWDGKTYLQHDCPEFEEAR